jgi:hypothetical protein
LTSRFRSPEVILFSEDLQRTAAFYKSLGFAETFRTPETGEPIHVDLALDDYKLGLASVASTRDDRVTRTEVRNLGWSGPAPPVHPSFPAHQGLTGAAVRSGRTVVSNDVGADPRYLTNQDTTGSELIVPILVAGTVVGRLDIEDPRTDAFDESDLHRFERLTARSQRSSAETRPRRALRRLIVGVAANRLPGVPGDLEDDERDHKPDDRIRNAEPRSNEECARDHAERHESVDARVVTVGNERGACEAAPGPETDLRRDLVPEEADRAGGRQQPKVGQLARIDEALDRLSQRDESADEDRQHDAKPSPPLAARASEKERHAERDRRERITEVVDQVGKQCDAQRPRVDEGLRQRRRGQDRQAPRHRTDARPRANDRRIDEAVRVFVTAAAVCVSLGERFRRAQHQRHVAVFADVRMAVHAMPVAMSGRSGHPTDASAAQAS